MKTLKIRALAALLTTLALFAVPVASHAAGSVTVHPGNLAGWTATVTGTGTGGLANGPGAPRLGSGAYRQTTTTASDAHRLATAAFNGTLLTNLTTLTYESYVKTTGGQAPSLVLSVDNDGNGSADDTLAFEPVYQNGTYGMVPGAGTVPNQCPGVSNCVAQNAWQRWDALAGGWWADSAGTFGPPLETIASYVAAHPGSRLATTGSSVAFRAGTGWGLYDGSFDAFTIGVSGVETAYDFEAALPTTTIVTPHTLGTTWRISGAGNGAFVTGPGTPPLGIGSFRQSIADGDDFQRIGTNVLNGLPLSGVNQLRYSTFATRAGGQAPYLNLYVDVNGDGVWAPVVDDILFFEPVYQTGSYPMVPGAGAVPSQCTGACVSVGSWQRWEADAGAWWSLNAGTGGPPLDTLEHYAIANPMAKIVTDPSRNGLEIVIGGGSPSWDAFEGNVDAVHINNTIFDLEPGALTIDCDTVLDDIGAIQAASDIATPGQTINLRGACDFTRAAAHGGDTTSIAATAILVRTPGITFEPVAGQTTTITGSGTQTAFLVAPGSNGVTIRGLRFVNLARPIAVVNASNVTIGQACATVPCPAGNRIIGNASMNSGIWATVWGPAAGNNVTYAFGVNGASTDTFTIPSVPVLDDLTIVGNYISYDPPGAPDGQTRDTIAIDVRQKNRGVADDILIRSNAVGMFASEFPSFNMMGVNVTSHSGSPQWFITDVTIEGNNLGRLEELASQPVADVHATGRTGILVERVNGFRIVGNGVRVRQSPTAIPMPGGGIVAGDSVDGEIRSNGVISIADPSTLESDLGAIGIIDDVNTMFASPDDPHATGDVLVRDNVIGIVGNGGQPVGAQRGIVVGGLDESTSVDDVTVTRNDVKFSSDSAIVIAPTITGPGSVATPGPVSAQQSVADSVFCENTLDGAKDAVAEVSFGLGTNNSFPGGAVLGQRDCGVDEIKLVEPNVFTSDTTPLIQFRVSDFEGIDPATVLSLMKVDDLTLTGSVSVIGPKSVLVSATAPQLGLGRHEALLRARDALGTSTTRVGRFSIVGTTAPAAPVITFPTANATTPTRITVTGTAQPGTTVVVSDGGVFRSSVVASNDGAWSSVLEFTEGSHAISAHAIDDAGREGVEGAVVPFTADATAPVVTITTPPNSILSGSSQITGTATDNRGVSAIVVQYRDLSGALVGQSTVVCTGCGTGSTTWTATTPGVPGYYQVTARATDLAGNRSTTAVVGVIRAV